MGKALATSQECYGMAFYTPPASDRISAIERENKSALTEIEARFDAYRATSEDVVRRILRLSPDTNIGINQHGEVHRYGGRIERIV